MIAQVAGCREGDGEVIPFVADEDAEFWSVYLGEPGTYRCIRDFNNKQDAVSYAFRLVVSERAKEVDNRTFSIGDYYARQTR